MPPQAKLRFPHRYNADGTYDSICIRCFLTIATVRHEHELAQSEASHACSAIRLYQVGEYPVLAGSGFDLLR